MAHKIIIDGEIGWEATASTVRDQIKEAKGQDLDVELSSPGGSVFEGITIYNLLKNYAGKVSITISGLAASMGSYIALAGDELTVSENSVYMIHNAWGFSGGDHKELKKTANLLESLTGLLNKAYVSKTGKSTEEIKNLMDDESWFFGSEIVEAGFADAVIESEVNEDREDAVLSAMLTVEACNTKLKAEGKKEDLEKAAALFKPAAKQQQPKQEEVMKPEEIKALEDAAFAKGAESVKVESKVEEPKTEESIDPSDMAMSILEGDYPAPVKALAKKVIKGEQTQENLEVLVLMVEVNKEQALSAHAQQESAGLGETPGEQAPESNLKDGKVVNEAGIKELGAQLKAANAAKTGAK